MLIPIDSALSFLAGPIVRWRGTDRARVLVPLRKPCDEVRLTVRQLHDGGRTVVAGAGRARPIERDGMRLAIVELELGRYSRAAPADLQWDLSLSVPQGAASAAWFGDLAMGMPLPVFLDVQPPLSEIRTGQLHCAFGPLQLGRLEFRVDSTGLAETTVSMVRAGLLAAMAADPGLERRVTTALRSRRGSTAQQVAQLGADALQSLCSQLLLVPFAALPTQEQVGLLSQMAAHTATLSPEVALHGNLQPRLLGMRLTSGSIPVRGSFSPTAVSFSCYLSTRDLLAPLVAAPWLGDGLSALLFASGPLPRVGHASDPLAARPTGADIPTDEQARRWQRLVNEGRWLFSFAGSFMGLELAGAGGRFGVPAVLPTRTAAGARETEATARAQVLSAVIAAQSGKPRLLDPQWDGQLTSIPGLAAPLRAQSLGEVFPSGGLFAGASLQLPRLLMQSPAAAWASLLGTAGVLLKPATWQSAARLRAVVAVHLEPQPFAQLGFHYPAPTAPIATSGRDRGSAAEAALAAWVARCRMDVLPAELPRNQNWPAAECLLEIAVAPGAQILGLPITGLKRISPPRSRTLQMEIGLQTGHWLHQLLGGMLPNTLLLDLSPPATTWRIRDSVELLATLLEAAGAGLSDTTVLREVAQRRSTELAQQLYGLLDLSPPAKPPDELTAPHIANGIGTRMGQARQAMQAARSGGNLEEAAGLLARMMFEALPRLAIRQVIDMTQLPGLPDVLTLQGRVVLEASSHASATPGMETALAGGGLFLEATEVEIVIGPISATLPNLRLEITPPAAGKPANLRGEMGFTSTLPGLTTLGARLLIDTASAWKVAVEIEIAPIHWTVPGLNAGSLRIEPLSGQVLSLRIEAVNARTILSPASLQVSLGLIEAFGRLRGTSPGQPLELSLEGGWSGRADFDSLRINNPFVPGTAVATWSQLGGVKISGHGLGSLGMSIENMPQRGLQLLQPMLPFNMTGLGALAFDSGGNFLLQAPVSTGIPNLATLNGTVEFSAADFLPQLAVQGILSLTPLAGFTLSGNVTLSPHRLEVQATGTPLSIGTTSLLELSASAWSVVIDLVDAGVTLQPTAAIQAKLLGSSLAPDATLSAGLSAATGLRLSYQSNSWWSPPGLTNLFALKPNLELDGSSLRVRGAYRLLKQSTGSTWKQEGDADWNWNASSNERPILIGDDLKHLFPVGGLFEIKNNGGLVLGRDDAWWLELRGFSVQVLFRKINAPTARLSTDGQISIDLADMNFSANGLTWTPGGKVRVRAHLRAASILPQYRIPAGPVAAVFAGWPDISLPDSGWQSSATPTAASEQSASGRWRNVPLLGGATRTQYRFDAPKVTVRLRATKPRLQGQVTTGGLRFRQWVPNNRLTPTNDAHWISLQASPTSQTFNLTAGGALASNIFFGLPGSGQEKPNLNDVLG